MKKKITGKVRKGHSAVHTAKSVSLSLKDVVRAFQILTVNSTLASHHRISKGQWCPQSNLHKFPKRSFAFYFPNVLLLVGAFFTFWRPELFSSKEAQHKNNICFLPHANLKDLLLKEEKRLHTGWHLW